MPVGARFIDLRRMNLHLPKRLPSCPSLNGRFESLTPETVDSGRLVPDDVIRSTLPLCAGGGYTATAGRAAVDEKMVGPSVILDGL